MKMQKIAILSVADLRHMTCVSSYCEFFRSHDIEFDIICTNRYEESVEYVYQCGIYAYQWTAGIQATRLQKVRDFVRFRKYAKKVLTDNSYDFVVVWGENAALLFSAFLERNFSGKYCINIRDVLSDLGVLRRIVEGCMKKAVFVTTPTPVPMFNQKERVFVLYNKDMQVLQRCQPKKRLKSVNEKLVITYMGLIYPYIDIFKQFIDVFGNDERFVLQFFGKGAEVELKQYAQNKGYQNIVLGGAFQPIDTAKFLDETDILDSYWSKQNSSMKYAVGVKESYGPRLRIPTIANAETYWAELSEKYGFGFSANTVDNLPDNLFNWYHSLKFEDFEQGCIDFCNNVDAENQKMEDVWKRVFINNEKEFN